MQGADDLLQGLRDLLSGSVDPPIPNMFSACVCVCLCSDAKREALARSLQDVLPQHFRERFTQLQGDWACLARGVYAYLGSVFAASSAVAAAALPSRVEPLRYTTG